MSRYSSYLSKSLAGLSLVALTAVTLSNAEAGAPFAIAGPAAVTPAAPVATGRLATLSSSAEQLMITGENATRQFAVFVRPGESTKASKISLSYQSTVSIMPESSSLQVFVNDRPVAETRLGLGGVRSLTAELSPGTLQPGFNQVRIVVDQHHRVDCSIAGTYELWTAIDPAQSGLQFDGDIGPVSAIEDLPALARLDTDGVTRIHGVLPEGATSKDIERTLSAVQSAVLLGGFRHPSVDFGTSADGAALAVEVGIDANRPVGNTTIPAVSFEPGAAGSPSRLIVSGTSPDEIDRGVAGLAAASQSHAPVGTPEGLQALRDAGGRLLTGGEVVTLHDLGLADRQFAGRFFRDSVRFRLPADFYPADYAEGSLTLDASYAAGLDRHAQLVIRANDRVISTIPLSSSKRGLIDRQKMRLPLSALQPGSNVLTFEAIVSNESDAACDPAAQANPPTRLFVSGTSALTLPVLARVGHTPDLAAMAMGGSNGSSDLSLLVEDLSPKSLGTAATFTAKLSASSGKTFDTHVLTAMPREATGNLVAFGTFAGLPRELLQTVRLAPASFERKAAREGLLVSPADAAETGNGWKLLFKGGTDEPAARGASPAPSDETKFDRFLPASSESEGLADTLMSMGSAAADGFFDLIGFQQNRGSDTVDPANFFQPAADTSLVVAQGSAPEQRGAAWTVVAARDAATLSEDVGLLTSTGRWDRLAGAVTSMSGEGKVMTSVAARDEELFETQATSLANGRLVIAGWFSRHSESYIVALLLACLALGLTTNLFLRNIGEKRR